MISRMFRDAGVLPIFAYSFLIAGFIAGSFYLFKKTEYAEYFYLLVAVFFVFNFSDEKRNDFLKISFSDDDFRKIRIFENLIVSFPFAIFLCFESFFVTAIILLTLAIFFALVGFRETWSFTLPTPFYKRPFEFTVGFRKSFYLFLAVYFLTFKAASVNNFNLGIILLLFCFAVVLNYYAKPENEYYVWSYSLNARQFLLEKIKIALLFSSFLIFPVVLILGISFYQNAGVLFLFLIIGYAALIAMIAAKYSAYPSEINLHQGFLLAVGILSPPLFLLLIPYFFVQSTKRLKHLLK